MQHILAGRRQYSARPGSLRMGLRQLHVDESTFTLNEEYEDLARAFQERHPDGICSAALSPDRSRWNREAFGNDTRYGVCPCFDRLLYVKSCAWKANFDAAWNHLPSSRDRYRLLRRNARVVSPLWHVRSSQAWTRVYPFWPIDLEWLLSSGAGVDLPVGNFAKILWDVMEGLCALESHGIIPGDLGTSKVLIEEYVQPAQGRRGIDASPVRPVIRAALVDYSENQSVEPVWGTAPELAEGRVDPATPLFGLGVIIWELLSRRSFRMLLDEFHGQRGVLPLPWPAAAASFLEGNHASAFVTAMETNPDWRCDLADDKRTLLSAFVQAVVVPDPDQRWLNLQGMVRRQTFANPDRPVMTARNWIGEYCYGALPDSGELVSD